MRTLLLALIGLLLPAAASADGLLPAPYQIDGAVQFRSDHHRTGNGLQLNAHLVAVDLGAAGKRKGPDSKKFAKMTILGSKGVARGTLNDLEKRCAFLCGDEGEECHFVALYELDGPLAEIGTPLVALRGHLDLAAYKPATPTAVTDDLALGAALSPPAWSPYAKEKPTHRVSGWDAAAKKLTLESRYGQGEVFAAPDSRCAVAGYGPLTGVTCNMFAVLLAGGRPVLVSYPDYNIRGAEVIASFENGGAAYYVVRLAIKAETVFGLLVQAGGQWRGLFRRRGYALLC